MTPGTDFLRLAARHYYYKPLAAFFNAFHLRAYQAAGIQLTGKVLDVGCSNGSFGVLLTDALGVRPRLTGIEVSAAALQQADPRAHGRYAEMIQAGAAELPFADGSFDTVLFNASLFAVDPGLDRALQEARRVLRPRGQLYATVSTDRYVPSCRLTQWMRGLGLNSLARRYIRAMDRRLMIRHPFTAAQWKSLLEDNGWEVETCFGFLSPALTAYWSVLAWTPWRILGLARLLPGPLWRKMPSRIYVAAFRRHYEGSEPQMDPETSTYLLIRAVKAAAHRQSVPAADGGFCASKAT